jgi:hypothetical protein
MPPTDSWLFDPDDLAPSPAGRSLAVRSTPGRPLGKDERAFNRALARVQALNRALEKEKGRLDRLLVFHAAEVRPRTDRAVALRADLVRALMPFLDDRRLTKAQHRVLRRILTEQLDDVVAHLDKPDAELQALFERLHGVSYAQAVQDDLKEVNAGMAAMFNELGLDIDVPELGPDMTDEEAAAMAAQLADELRRAEESRDGAAQRRRPNKARAAAEERARRHEELRKDSLRVIYRRLVKELHPDLERDPTESDKKGRGMQDITAAYARGDLLALLQLELQWLGKAGGDATRLGRDKLQTYTELLKQQAIELSEEIQSLQLYPRYADLIVEGPFGLPAVIDGPGEVERLDAVIAQVRSALARLSSRDALQEVRAAIREYRNSEKEQTRAGRRGSFR